MEGHRLEFEDRGQIKRQKIIDMGHQKVEEDSDDDVGGVSLAYHPGLFLSSVLEKFESNADF